MWVADLVGHAAHLHTIGDAAMHALIEMHDTLVLREIKMARGIAPDHTGDRTTNLASDVGSRLV